MNDFQKKWFYLVLLALVWGSSFILIKKALIGLSPIQLGGLRIVIASLTLFALGFKSLSKLSVRDWKWVVAGGLLSSFFPPFLFALAQTQLDSGVTAIFNSTVPLLTSMVGIAMFGALLGRRQLVGVFIGLFGTVVLIVSGMELVPDQNYWYASFILLSALGYAFNINIIKSKLPHLSALAVTTGSFAVAFVPALCLVVYSGFFSEVAHNVQMQDALWYLLALAIFGTAVANMYFNKLIHVSSPVFAASVTYLIPLVAILWGVWDGESINVYQLLGGVIILFGVWLVNKKKKTISTT
ncbi:EamA family transporter [Maribacter sp.]|nr:EamA family transporter [Maribacter sp.]